MVKTLVPRRVGWVGGLKSFFQTYKTYQKLVVEADKM